MGILNTHTQIQNTTTLFSDLCAKSAKIAVVGLDTEGLSTALFLASKYRVIGYDNNRDCTSLIQQQKDPNKKIAANQFMGKDFFATNITNLLEAAQFFVITIASNNLIFKKRILAVAKHLKVGDVVVFQNSKTTTNIKEAYINLLERVSGLLNNVDFTIVFTKTSGAKADLHQTNTVVQSADKKTRAVVMDVFKTVTVLTVVKSIKQQPISVVADRIESALKVKQPLKNRYTVLLKGITTKANCNELQNSKAVDLYVVLCRKGLQVKVQDNHVLSSQVESHCGIELTTSTSQRFDAIISAVEHDNYEAMTLKDFEKNSNSTTLHLNKCGFERIF